MDLDLRHLQTEAAVKHRLETLLRSEKLRLEHQLLHPEMKTELVRRKAQIHSVTLQVQNAARLRPSSRARIGPLAV